MSSIPGPIIRFRIDTPQVASASASAFDGVKKQARQATTQIADDWKRMSAQIRASMAQESMSTREIASARRSIVSVLNQEITAYRTKAELNSKELATLKAMTLELERQKSHIADKGGLTAGSAAFSTQTYLGVTRALDSIVNRYFGGAAGSLFRTVRDLGYYGSIGAGAGAGEGGSGGIFSKLTSPTGLGILGSVGALTAVGTAMTVMAVKGGKLALELEDMAQKTGLSTAAAIKLQSIAGVLGVSMDSLNVGFKKFDTLIVEANAGNQKASALFRALGVDIKKAAEDPYSAIQQLAVSLGKLPDGALKTATATALFGRGGQQLLPVLSEMAQVAQLTRASSADLAHALGNVADTEIALRAAMVNWRNESEALEISLAQHLLPTLTHLVGFINTAFPTTAASAYGLPSASTALNPFLKKHGYELSQYGQTQLQAFIEATRPGPSLRSNPQEFFQRFTKWANDPEKLIEPFHKAAAASDELKKALGDLVGGMRKARDAQAEFWKSVGEELYRTGAASGHPFYPVTADQVLQRVFNPQRVTAPRLGIGASTGNALAGVGLGSAGSGVSVGATQQDILQVILGGDYSRIFNTRQDEYNRELVQLKDALNQKLISYQQYNTAVQVIEDDLHKELLEKDRQFQSQADELFEQLINGDRNVGRTLVKDLRDAMLAPIRNSFDQVVGGLLGGFSRGVQSGFNGTVGVGLSRFATVPFLGNLIPGLSGKGNAPTGTSSDPIYVTMPGLGAGGVTGLGAGIGSLPLIGPGGSLIPGASSSGGGGILGLFRSFLGGRSGSGGLSANPFGSTAFGLGSAAGTIGGGALLGLGSSTGGALGGLEGAAGGALSGALTGFTFGGPVGAAIGGIIGGIGGLISGIIGPSFQDRVRKSMVNQQYYLPPSETFSFASNGSIANTLSTGFSSSGGRFSNFNLPNGTPFFASPVRGPLSYSQYLALQNQQNTLDSNQPFLGFPGTNPYVGQGSVGSNAQAPQIHFNLPGYVDGPSAAAAIAPVAETIAQLVSNKVSSSASAFGRNARRAVNLP